MFGEDSFRVISTSSSNTPPRARGSARTFSPRNTNTPGLAFQQSFTAMQNEDDDGHGDSIHASSDDDPGRDDKLDTIEESVLQNRSTWNDGLGLIAEEGTTNAVSTARTNKEGQVAAALCESTEPLSDAVLRKLISGKTMEAISWFVGNDGVTYCFYQRLSAAMNFYIKASSGEGKYPSYGTILKRSSKLYNSHAFTRRFECVAEVNTNLSGVSQKLVQEQRTGNTPTQTFSVIFPSDWARKDLLQYEYLRGTMKHNSRVTSCLYIDHAPVVDAVNRQSFNRNLCELFIRDRLYTYGISISMGESIRLRLTGSSSDMRE